MDKTVHIIGAGLAGCEAALFLASKDIKVNIYENKRIERNMAQSSENFAELVCSNSFRGLTNAVGELKKELIEANSALLNVALDVKVPAGNALAVDRERFSNVITNKIVNNPNITVFEEEITDFERFGDDFVIVATGPLTTSKLTDKIQKIIEAKNFYFFDAIAPIVDAETLNYDKVFRASRWGRGESEEGDYLNCPMNRDEFENFITLLKEAEKVSFQDFEKEGYFEGCLPIEVMLDRSPDMLRYGPMKPVGLKNPKEPGVRYYAVVQLRAENLEGTHYNLVGFQTKLTYPEQKRVFSSIPGLENAEFVRYGSIHKNSFINAPLSMNENLSLKNRKNIFISGQLSGVEGYVESIAMGFLSALSIYRELNGSKLNVPNRFTALGALYSHLINSNPENFQPSNINFSLFQPLGLSKIGKKERDQKRSEYAFETFCEWLKGESL
ncbi:methylenetetrahydrofolate--tRNA-(uracil(54)-C(5))-methyltransferase (FADH(2)-oxidizing) TrmFO [bacterium]|nr:methylenetetrahydrofolate--tRNA-(uracil(54)-C(5))-methyltransferase (FADH(2)-oxidizing) TrmFO [bacterium]